jgi:hypothetical protein
VLTFFSHGGGYKGRVPAASIRLFALVSAAAALACAVAVAGVRASTTPASTIRAQAGLISGPRYFDNGPVPALSRKQLAVAAPGWRGGPTTAATGETVNVYVSDSLPPDNTPQQWADFLSSLTHGSELSLLTMYVATLEEVQSECGSNALGCYGGNQMIVPGETVFDGTTPQEIIRHEYGHHIAYNRQNPPWVAVDWGPKNWASSANVCSKAAQKQAFPGDEGSNYALNPGEAWAETYRLMDEQKAGITTATWGIISPSFYPTSAALVAAQTDVLQPWTTPTTTASKHTFPKKAKKAWLVPLKMPLDGDFKLSATLPSGSEATVALLGANRTTVVGRAQWVSQRVKRLATTICGQRSGFVRVTPSGSAGLVRVSVTTP